MAENVVPENDIPTTKAGKREWLGLAALVLPTLIISMDLVVLILATPALSADLQPSNTQLLWITDIYGFLIAGSLITMGTLGDRIGRRRLLLIGATAFGLASVLAAFAPTPELLIAARALLGIAGATLMPSTLALLRNLFTDPGQRTVAIGLWVTSFSVGVVIGPVVAGLLLQYFWWGSVFLLNLPVMVVLLIVGPLLLPEVRDPGAGRFDLLSAALSLVAVLAIVYGVKDVAAHGLTAAAAVAVVVGLVVGGFFVSRQRRLVHPLIDLRLFGNPAFSASVGVNILIGTVMAGIFFLIAQHLQLVIGLSPLEAGLWLLPQAVAIIAASMLSTALVRKIPARVIVGVGLAIAAAGLIVITQASSSLALLIVGTVVMGLGVAPASTLSVDLIIGAAPAERAGAASAISETAGELGNALGIALLGSVGVAVYRAAMDGAVPGSLPAADAAAAADSLAGAVTVAGTLPADVAGRLMAEATSAFASGLQLSAWVGAAVAIVSAVVVPVVLRRAR
ncbi:MFS transporter [Pseudonocardia sp. TRM90224]|uniref:MFS transporter n=1 Tax=Pseudonocardia sp. TRM90224 TaxID=2812678 RepID=UPI001E5CFFAD|nr:MFS transporter [Pseudonocardia sp. TRM90224]